MERRWQIANVYYYTPAAARSEESIDCGVRGTNGIAGPIN